MGASRKEKEFERILKLQTLSKIENQNQLNRQSIKQQKEQFEAYQMLELEKLKVKDRVDLSLKEYNEMRELLKDYKERNNLLRNIIEKFKLYDFVDDIDPNTVQSLIVEDPIHYRKKITLTFEISTFPKRR